MSRIDITQENVLELLVKHLRKQLDLGPRQCYESLAQQPPQTPASGDYIVTVEPGDGVFPEGEQVSGNITEEWTVAITAYSRVHLDEPDHDEKMLRGSERSLLELKRLLLKAVVGKDLTDADGDTFLRWLLRVQRAERPAYDKSRQLGWITMHVGVDFDWNIT